MCFIILPKTSKIQISVQNHFLNIYNKTVEHWLKKKKNILLYVEITVLLPKRSCFSRSLAPLTKTLVTRQGYEIHGHMLCCGTLCTNSLEKKKSKTFHITIKDIPYNCERYQN